jgi:hypothetical protein
MKNGSSASKKPDSFSRYEKGNVTHFPQQLYRPFCKKSNGMPNFSSCDTLAKACINFITVYTIFRITG